MLNIKSTTTLSESVEDHSRAEVSVELRNDSGSVSNSLTLNAHADPHTEERRVWLSMRVHNWTTLGDSWSAPAISRGFDLIGQTFSREEAEALVAILSHELKKFEEDDKAHAEAEQAVFI